MNILIVSHFYNQDGVIGSVRWTQFAKRLSKRHHVTVVAHRDNADMEIENTKSGIKVIYLDNVCKYLKKKKGKGSTDGTSSVSGSYSTRKRSKNYPKEVLRNTLYMHSIASKAQENAKKVLVYLKGCNEDVNLVITTSRPFIDCFIGYELAEKMNCKWLLDQRDLPYSDGASKIEILFYRTVMRKLNEKVGLYTLVSKGMKQNFIDQFGIREEDQKKVKVLYNGYTKTDIQENTVTEHSQRSKLSIAYVGDLYAGKRDASILFNAIWMVLEKNADISEDDFEIVYAGGCGTSLIYNAEKYGLEKLIKDCGRVPHFEAIKIMQESDVALLLTWNTYMIQGVLPAKMYEYMLINKPVICITAGNMPYGEAGMMVEELNLGISVDYLNYEDGVRKLASYLEKQVNRLKSHQNLEFEPRRDLVNNFDYDHLVLELEKMIEDM